MNKVRLALYLGILVHLIGCSSFHSEKIDSNLYFSDHRVIYFSIPVILDDFSRN
jgi:hypothetical protein